jgi:Tfp pilus assembly protein PilE
MKKGISLIVLVITIIVIIILAGAVILSLSQNNPIFNATEATFRANLSEYNNELAIFISSEYVKNTGKLNLSNINATNLTGTYAGKTLKDIITSMTTSDLSKFQIEVGKLIYTGSNGNEKIWANSMSVLTGSVKTGLLLKQDFTSKTNSDIDKDIAQDFSGNNNNGSLVGFEYDNLSGYDSNGLNFDSTNDMITFPSTIDLQNIWSIEISSKFYNLSKTFQFFLGTRTIDTEGKILLNYNGYISFRTANNVYTNFSVLSSEINNVDSILTFVSNGTTVKLYVNSVLRSTITPSSTYCRINCIGNAWSDLVWLSKLKLYNIKVYNREITDTEILQNYIFEKSRSIL